jgi:hypothetical protein
MGFIGRKYADHGVYDLLRFARLQGICSAFLAYKERPQWIWFAGLAVLAGIGGLLTLGIVHAQQLAWRS